MGSACRFIFLVVVFHASYTCGMESSKPYTDLLTAGSSAPSLHTTSSPERDHVLDCIIFSTGICDVNHCQEAGARCAPSSTGQTCSPKIQFDTGELEYRRWSLHVPTQSVCKGCSCRATNPARSILPLEQIPGYRSPERGDEMRCQIRGPSSCNSLRCKGAGGRCSPSRSGKSCSQKIQFESGELSGQRWRLFDATRRECRDCQCLVREPTRPEESVGVSFENSIGGLGSPSLEKCRMWKKAGMDCNIEGCKGADGRCVLEPSGYCYLDSLEYGVAACHGCRCRRKIRFSNQ
jgi:hypothetical protein